MMLYERFFNTQYQKKAKITLALFYSLILLSVYSAFCVVYGQSAATWLQNDMQKKLDIIFSEIEAGYEKKIVDLKYLAQDNTLKMPMVFSLPKTVKEVIENARMKHSGSYDSIIITDQKNKVLYNSSGFSDSSGVLASYGGRGWYILDSIPVYIYYEPMTSAKERIGGLYVFYRFSDFYNTFKGQLLTSGYSLFGFYEGKVVFHADMNKYNSYNKHIGSSFFERILTKPFHSFIINGMDMDIYSRAIAVNNHGRPLLISVGIEGRAVDQQRWKFIKQGMRTATLIAFIITALFILMVKGTSYFISKDYTNKMELQNLYVQSHDFSKHLNIISAMAFQGDYEDLRQYVGQLGSRVIFTGSLLKLNCPPLNLLIQEKKAQANENGIEFHFDGFVNVQNTRISALDLCTVCGNLIDNAIEASVENDSSCKVVWLSFRQEEECFTIHVANTGRLHESTDIEKLFLPGYSTKRDRKGRGMGLYIIKTILRKYGGYIQVQNNDNVTGFTVFLPR